MAYDGARALRPDEKLHAPVHAPLSGYPTSEVFSRQQQGERGMDNSNIVLSENSYTITLLTRVFY